MSVNIDYSLLFYKSPMPNWVYEIETLRIIDVNQAAVRHYGYSREEFLCMTIKDLRSKNDAPKVKNAILPDEKVEEKIYSGIFTHQKKNGEKIRMDFNGHKLDFQNKECMLVTCRDVTSFYNEKTQKELFAKISKVFNIKVDQKTSLDQLCQLIVEFGEFNLCEIWLPTVHQNSIKLFSNHIADTLAQSFYIHASELNEFGFGEGLPGSVWKSMIPIIWEDVGLNEFFIRDHAAKKAGLKTVLGIP